MCVVELVKLVRPDGSWFEQRYPRLCAQSRAGQPCENVIYRDLGDRSLPPLGGSAAPQQDVPFSAGPTVPMPEPTSLPSTFSKSGPSQDRQTDVVKPKDRSKNYWVRKTPVKLGLGLFKRNSQSEKKEGSRRKGKEAEVIPEPPPRRPTAPMPPPAVPNWGQAPPPPPPSAATEGVWGQTTDKKSWDIPSPTMKGFQASGSSLAGTVQRSPTLPPQQGRSSGEPVFELRDPPHRRLSNASAKGTSRRANIIHQPSLRIPTNNSNRGPATPTPPQSGSASSGSESVPPYNRYGVSPPSTVDTSPPPHVKQRQSAPANIQKQSDMKTPGVQHRPSASLPEASATRGPSRGLHASYGRQGVVQGENDPSAAKSTTERTPKGAGITPNPDEELALRASYRESRRLERERNDLEAALRAREAELRRAHKDLEQERERNKTAGQATKPTSSQADRSKGPGNDNTFQAKSSSSYPHPLRSNPPRPSTNQPSDRATYLERERQRELNQLREEERTGIRARIARLERETSDLRRKREAAQEALVSQIEADERQAREDRPQLGSSGPRASEPPSYQRHAQRSSMPSRPSPIHRTSSQREAPPPPRRAHHSDGDLDYGRGGHPQPRSGVTFDIPHRGGQSGQRFSWRSSNVSIPSGLRRSNTFTSGSGNASAGTYDRGSGPPPPSRGGTSGHERVGRFSYEQSDSMRVEVDDNEYDEPRYGSESILRARDKEARQERKDRRRRSRDREDRRFWK